jgi:hypothetical protein
MPYQTSRGTFERASKLGHVPIAESEFIKSRLQNYRVFNTESIGDVADNLLIAASALPDFGFSTKWAMSFDGSTQEVATKAAYPSTRVGYIQIAGVLVHLEEMLQQARQQFVDPAVIRTATRQSLFSVVLPGSNVCRADMLTVRDSWRAEIFELFRDYKIEGQPILDMLINLLAIGGRKDASGNIILGRCSATRLCTGTSWSVPRDGCLCPVCGGHLFPTDALRVHEEVEDLVSNATSLGRLMNILEQIAMLCYLGFLFERQPRVLSNVAFIVDGPLAMFGPSAPLQRSILLYLQYVARELQRRNYGPPIVFGLEKTGYFAEHAQELAQHLPNQTLMRLPDEYIFRRILTSRAEGNAGFGDDTYYGRKFFYKTNKGQMLTLTIPCLDNSLLTQFQPDDPSCYVTLGPTLALLDEIGTKLYQDAIIPVALAHNYASIPLKTGSKVLTLLSKEFLGQGS